jgi:hypothetical protein
MFVLALFPGDNAPHDALVKLAILVVLQVLEQQG